MCGKLFCQGGSRDLPWKGFTVSILTCKMFDPEDTSQGIGMVANGTKCGNSKVIKIVAFIQNNVFSLVLWVVFCFASQLFTCYFVSKLLGSSCLSTTTRDFNLEHYEDLGNEDRDPSE
jgi:hypothetical protein